MAKIGNRFVQAPSHGGPFDGRKRLVVIHTLECDARENLAYDLATGYIQNEGVSPHTLSDPGETVGVCDTNTVGYHIGGGNPYGTGAEVTGRAAWTTAQWQETNPNKALERQAIALAEQCLANGFGPQDVRYLSLNEVADGHTKGICTHNDISTAPWGFRIGTDHWDPGLGYPFKNQMIKIRYYFGCLDYWGDDIPNHVIPTEHGSGGGAQEEFDLLRWISETAYD